MIDPVCGMKVGANTELTVQKHGQTYYFCSRKCREKFEQDPGRYDLEKARHTRDPGRGRRLQDYVPLFVLLSFTLLAASARQAAASDWSWMSWMHDFMGLFLVVFAMFKFFDLKGFATGFAMYDLLAKRWKGWGYLYPFLELALGLAFLARWEPMLVYGLTAGLLAFGALGVLHALRQGLDIECACMGTVLHVPLSTVALLEDVAMAAMAGSMFFARV